MKLKRLVSLALAPILLAQFVLGFQASAHADTFTLINATHQTMIDPNTLSTAVGVSGDTFTFTTPNDLGTAPTITFSGSSNNTAVATQVGAAGSKTYSVALPSGAISGPYSVTSNGLTPPITATGTSNFQLWNGGSIGEPYSMPKGHVNITYQDLKFILDNIKIAEAHSIRTTTAVTGAAQFALNPGTPTSNLVYPYDVTSANRCMTATDIANAALNAGNYQLGATGLSQPFVWTAEDPFGLRQVDGQCNNISNVQAEPAQTTIWSPTQTSKSTPQLDFVQTASTNDTAGWGAADELFTRTTPPTTKTATSSTSPYTLNQNQGAYFDPTKNVVDASPRDISNLISDQSVNNPAAVAAAYETMDILYASTSYSTQTSVNATSGNLSSVLDIPNITADYNVSAGYDSTFTLFGQFFDHGLDLIPKAGPFVLIPLKADDPLYDTKPGANNFMVLTRGQDANGDSINETTPWVDQSQTYGSHPSQNFFLREYADDGVGGFKSTGRLLEGRDAKTKPTTLAGTASNTNEGLPTWADVKAQTKILGFELTDFDARSVPVIATDQYGKFIPGPHKFPMMLFTDAAASSAVSSTYHKYVWIEGNASSPIKTGSDGFLSGSSTTFPTISGYTYPTGTGSNWVAVSSGHSFINDTTASAVPFAAGYCNNNRGGYRLTADTDSIVNSAAWSPNCDTYDNEALNLHYVAGDGRVNENIGLSAFHNVFHHEHNLVVADVIAELNNNPVIPAAFANEFLLKPDRLYQVGRFLLEMEYQHMAYDEFVRRISPELPVFLTYQPKANPAVSQEFASAVYRLGHSMLNETIPRANPGSYYDPLNNQDVSLLNAFTNPAQSRLPRPAIVDKGDYSAGTITYTMSWDLPTGAIREPVPSNGDIVTISNMADSTFNVVDGVVTNSSSSAGTFSISQKYVSGSLTSITPTTTASSSGVPDNFNNQHSIASVAISDRSSDTQFNFPYTPKASAAAIIQGLTSQRGNEIDEFTTDAVRNNLLGLPLDLPSLNLTRGRDVGAPTLNQFRAKNSTVLPPYVSWKDFITHLRHPQSGANFIAAYGTHPSLLNPVQIAKLGMATSNSSSSITYQFQSYAPLYLNMVETPKTGDVVTILGYSEPTFNVTNGIIASVNFDATGAAGTFTINTKIGNDLTQAKSYAVPDTANAYIDLTPTALSGIATAGTTSGTSGVYTNENITRAPSLSERRAIGNAMVQRGLPIALTGATINTSTISYAGSNTYSPGQIVTVTGIKETNSTGLSSCTSLNTTGTVVTSDATGFELDQNILEHLGITAATYTRVGSNSTSSYTTYTTDRPTTRDAGSYLVSGSVITITGLSSAKDNSNATKNYYNQVAKAITAVDGTGPFWTFRIVGKLSNSTSASFTYAPISGESGLYEKIDAGAHVLPTCTYKSGGYVNLTTAANQLWANVPLPPSDSIGFLTSSGSSPNWKNDLTDPYMGPTGASRTGLDAVDLWMGGLAENPAKQPILPPMLGPTFEYVYTTQVQALQDADRFYYIGRLLGYNLGQELPGQKFADLVRRNTPSVDNPSPDNGTSGIVGLTDPMFGVTDCAWSTTIGLVPVSQRCDVNTMWTDPITTNVSHVGLDNVTMFVDPASTSGFVITGGAGDDSIQGGNGNDTLYGGIGGDLIRGGAGNDRIFGGGGEDIIQGGSGNDTINAGDSQIGDLADGGTGSDWITCGNCNAIVASFQGEAGNDFIQGGKNADLLLQGGEGDDWLEGLDGWDIMDGDSGNTQNIYNQSSQIIGGNDVLFGGSGVDTMSGDGGDDIFLLGMGVGQPFGMDGFDWADYEYSTRYDNGASKPTAPRPNIWVDLTGAQLSPNTARQGDMLSTMEAVSGSSGNDQIYGGIGTADATYNATVTSGSNMINVLSGVTIIPGQQVSGKGIAPNAVVVSALIVGNRTNVTLNVASTATSSSTPVIFTTWPLAAPSLITNLTSLVSGTPGWTKYSKLDATTVTTKWSGGAIMLGGDGNDSIYPSSGSDVIHGSAYLHTCIAVDSSINTSVYSALADVPCGNGSSSQTLRGFSNMSLISPLLESGQITPDKLQIVRELLPTSSAVTSVTSTVSNITYTASNNYYVGEFVTVAGLSATDGITDMTPYNLNNVAVTGIGAGTFSVANTVSAPAVSATAVLAGTALPTDTLDLSGGSTVATVGTVPVAGGGISGPSNQFSFKKLTGTLPVGASWGCTVTDSSSGEVITVFDMEMVKFTTGAAVSIPNCGPLGVPSAPTNVVAVAENVGSVQDIKLTWVAPNSNGSPIDYYSVQYLAAAQGGGGGGRGNSTNVPSGTCSGQVSPALATTGCTVLGLTKQTSYTFTVAAHNAVGLGAYSQSSNAAIFPAITAPSITYDTATVIATIGTPIPTAHIVNTGGPIVTTSYTTSLANKALPAGISFDPVTGTISGTPAVGSQIKGFTLVYSATNQSGTSTATFTLTINAAPVGAPVISFSPNSGGAIAGSAMPIALPVVDPTNPIDTNGFALTVTIGGVVVTTPTWVVFSTSNGSISGPIPTGTANGAIVFNVTATGSGGTGTATYTLNVTGAPAIRYVPNNATTPHGTAFATATPTNTGGAATSFACSVQSPSGRTCANALLGVSFNSTDGSISGTPDISLAAQTVIYSVTATNSAGTSAPATFTLSITDPVGGAPVAPQVTPPGTPVGGAPQAALTFTNNAAAPLPAGTSITLAATSTATGRISYTVSGANCQLTRNILVATAAGATCVVTATQAVTGGTPVTQSATFTFGLQAQAALRINNRVRTTNHGLGITLSTAGGSGSGAVTYQVVPGGTGTACRITTDGTGVTSPDAGTTCNVTATKAASGVFDAVTSSVAIFTFQ